MEPELDVDMFWVEARSRSSRLGRGGRHKKSFLLPTPLLYPRHRNGYEALNSKFSPTGNLQNVRHGLRILEVHVLFTSCGFRKGRTDMGMIHVYNEHNNTGGS